MFRAIGFLIILWGLSQYFSASFTAFDQTSVAVLKTIEVAADESRESIAAGAGVMPTP
jgi:Mg2+/Co2+ transporter CorB